MEIVEAKGLIMLTIRLESDEMKSFMASSKSFHEEIKQKLCQQLKISIIKDILLSETNSDEIVAMVGVDYENEKSNRTVIQFPRERIDTMR